MKMVWPQRPQTNPLASAGYLEARARIDGASVVQDVYDITRDLVKAGAVPSLATPL